MGFPYLPTGAGTLSHYPCGPSGGSPNENAATIDDIENAQKMDAKGGFMTIGFLGNGSPPGGGNSRGPISRAGSPGSYASRLLNHTIPSTFDIRGLTSHAMVMWVRINDGISQPFAWSNWHFTAANTQAWVLWARHGVDGGPRFAQYDGLSLNNSLAIKASSTNEPIDNISFHMIGGGYNADTNVINCFWGDGSDSSGNTFYYQESAGFVAGYAATLSDGQFNNIGEFATVGVPDFDIDHASHWKGRAFNEQDYLNHWQAGTGLLRSEFDEDPGRGVAQIGRTISAALTGRPIDSAALTGRPIDSAALTCRPVVAKNV